MSIEPKPELVAELTRIANRSGRSVQELANEVFEEYVEYDHWFSEKVAAGRNQMARGESLSHEEVGQRMTRLFTAA
jgi:predicted transcriptional regulator